MISRQNPHHELNSGFSSLAVVSIAVLAFLTFGFVLFIDFIPTVTGGYADQRIALAVSMVGYITFGLLWLSNRAGPKSALVMLWPFLLMGGVFLLAVVQHHSNRFSLIEAVFYALYFFVFGLVGCLLNVENLARKAALSVVMVAAVACFFYAAMTITVYLFAITDDFSELDHVIPWGFVSIRYWSHIATWLVPLFPLFLLTGPLKENRLWRIASAFTAAIWWWMLFMSSSRGSVIGLCVGLFLVWLCFGRSANPWVALFVRFAVYGLITWLILSVIVPSLVFDDLQIRGVGVDSSGRMPLWQEAWAMSMQNFPFGMGPQAWLTHEVLTESYRKSPPLGHPHNMYLMWAAEYGWISIAGLAVLCGVALRRLIFRAKEVRSGTNRHGLWLAAFTGSVTAALVHAGVSAVFIAPGSMLVGLLALSVFWALIQPAPAVQPTIVASSRTKLSRLIGLGVAIILIIGSLFWFRDVLRYQQAMIDDLAYYHEEVPSGYLPRFWFHGYFPRPQSLMPSAKD